MLNPYAIAAATIALIAYTGLEVVQAFGGTLPL